MATRAARKLLVVSSESRQGDAEGVPTLSEAMSGPLGAAHALHESGGWPRGLDLVVVSDLYGLVEPLDEASQAVPVPFSRGQNPGWWADFVSHNLSRLVEKRGYTSALVLPNPDHEAAVRSCAALRSIETVWGNKGVAGLAGAELLRAWLSGKRRGGRKAATQQQEAQATAPGDAPPSARHALLAAPAKVVEDSIYSDRFMLVVSKSSQAELDAVQEALRLEWGRRRLKGVGGKAVSNLVLRGARLPWSHRPAATLCNRLLENVGMAALLGSINKAVAQLAITEPGRYREILARIPDEESEFTTDLLHLLWEASSRMDKDEIALLRAYLLDQCTHSELRRLGLPRNLGLEDRYVVLSAVLKCFTGLAPAGSLGDYRRVWLVLDEADNLLGYDERERWEVVKALETLSGSSPRYLTVWLNISPSSKAGAADIQAALENDLRVTDNLVVG